MNAFVNKDAEWLEELAEKLTQKANPETYARLIRIANNLQRMDEKLMNQNRFEPSDESWTDFDH